MEHFNILIPNVGHSQHINELCPDTTPHEASTPKEALGLALEIFENNPAHKGLFALPGDAEVYTGFSPEVSTTTNTYWDVVIPIYRFSDLFEL